MLHVGNDGLIQNTWHTSNTFPEKEREGREGEMYKQEINHPDTFYITPHLPFEPSFVLIEYPSSIAALSQFLMKENVYREGIFFNTQYHLPLIGDGCRPPFEET